jgi:hypothetical protein
MFSTRHTSKIRARNEPKTFMSKHTSRETSSSKTLLKSIKVDERKCEDEIGLPSLSNVFYFTTKTLGATFATDAIVLEVKIMP